MKARHKVVAVAAGVAALGAITASSASALNYGSLHPITGTCYADGSWFTSNNVRTPSSGADSIRVQFSQTPTKGIAFYVYDINTGIAHGTVYAPPQNTWLDLADGDAPRQFVNVFKLENGTGGGNYNFNGSEQY